MEKTLLFGNGINRAIADNSDYCSWDKLLQNIGCKIDILNCNQHMCKYPIQNVSNTLLYENAFLSNKTILDEERIKNIVIQEMARMPVNRLYEKAINSSFNQYITTNYDNAFIDSVINLQGEEIGSDNSEKIYSIRRYSQFMFRNRKIKLWHMHGRLSNYKSIQLGLDHYAGSIGKIDAYLKGNYDHIVDGKTKKILEVEDKHNTNELLDRVSWIDLFFDSNIHIIGLGLDYSEIDLWWVLNKRARLKKSGKVITDNKIFYYSNSKMDSGKEKLLESFDVEVKHVIHKNSKNEINYEQGILEALQIANDS